MAGEQGNAHARTPHGEGPQEGGPRVRRLEAAAAASAQTVALPRGDQRPADIDRGCEYCFHPISKRLVSINSNYNKKKLIHRKQIAFATELPDLSTKNAEQNYGQKKLPEF